MLEYPIPSKTNQKIWNYLARALAAAKPTTDEIRDQRIGVVGVTRDGFESSSRNLSSQDLCPPAHAEYRLMKRMPKGCTIFVARAMKSGNIGLAKPCKYCKAFLKGKDVTVYYTIDNNTFGVTHIK